MSLLMRKELANGRRSLLQQLLMMFLAVMNEQERGIGQLSTEHERGIGKLRRKQEGMHACKKKRERVKNEHAGKQREE